MQILVRPDLKNSLYCPLTIIAHLKGKLSEIRWAIIIHLNFIWCMQAQNFAIASHSWPGLHLCFTLFDGSIAVNIFLATKRLSIQKKKKVSVLCLEFLACLLLSKLLKSVLYLLHFVYPDLSDCIYWMYVILLQYDKTLYRNKKYNSGVIFLI